MPEAQTYKTHVRKLPYYYNLVFLAMLVAWLLLAVMQTPRFPLHWPAWRFAQASLKRRPSASALQIVSLALGLMALLVLTLVREDLLAAWRHS